MMIPDSAIEAWTDARARSPLRHYGKWRPQWYEYWDEIAAQCQEGELRPRGLEREIVRYLLQQQLLVPGDQVLDVGCGAGTFTLPFAATASGVTGVDPSAVMLSRLHRAAKRACMDNIRTLRTTWEDYRPAENYDLVFSAFCPGIYDRHTLARMEQASARSCCYVAGDISHFHLLSQLWGVVTGECFTAEAWDVAHPLDYLRSAGRNPRVRRFRSRSIQRVPSRDAVDEFAAYFRSFIDLRPGEYKKIRHFIETRSSGGQILLGKERTTWAVSWDVPARS